MKSSSDKKMFWTVFAVVSVVVAVASFTVEPVKQFWVKASATVKSWIDQLKKKQ